MKKFYQISAQEKRRIEGILDELRTYCAEHNIELFMTNYGNVVAIKDDDSEFYIEDGPDQDREVPTADMTYFEAPVRMWDNDTTYLVDDNGNTKEA